MFKKILFLTLLSSCPYILAATASQSLQSKLNAIKTLSADFNQVVKTKNKEISHSFGTMALSRPGRFRWATQNPMAQLIVADGQRVWIYDVDLEQVSVKQQVKNMGGTAGLFLSGYDETVARDFDVTETVQHKSTVFNLTSKIPKAQFQRVKLVFEGKVLRDIVLYDQLDQMTDVTLSHVKTNQTLSALLFQFKPPKGVDVVEQ